MNTSQIIERLSKQNLIAQISVGILIGAIFGSALRIYPVNFISVVLDLFGTLFVGALKGIAPIIVFSLICEAIATKKFTHKSSKGLEKLILLYIVGTFAASLCAVLTQYISPLTLVLRNSPEDISAETINLSEVLINLAKKAVDNPTNALATGNFISIVVWAIGIGIALRNVSDTTKNVIADVSKSILKVVRFVIRLAPLGIFGLVATSIIQTGFDSIGSYLKLVSVLVICMLFVAFVINAAIVFFITHKNPYPLIFTCIRESAVTAFFTRSSAANIPVNIELAKKLNINESLYSVSIPLGATVNTAGAAITIAILTLAAANTLHIQIDFMNCMFLCFIAAIAACGAGGIAGGSLMLVPLACSMFGISNDVAAQVVAIGFIISVIQDSFETALNSSSDVLFTAAVSQSLEKE